MDALPEPPTPETEDEYGNELKAARSGILGGMWLWDAVCLQAARIAPPHVLRQGTALDAARAFLASCLTA